MDTLPWSYIWYIKSYDMPTCFHVCRNAHIEDPLLLMENKYIQENKLIFYYIIYYIYIFKCITSFL